MSARYRWGLIGAFILQVGLLGWMIADRAMLLQNGREIRLAVVPIDPRDLFRGDYVTLSYAISRIHAADVAGDEAFDWGDTMYVTIEEEGVDSWRATAIAKEKPAAGMFLRGTVTNVSDVSGDQCPPILGCKDYFVDYNLEQFFVPEGTGRELETLRNDQKISVDVAVANDGRAALKRLLVDGVVRYDEPLY
jgi:uncharacterized membrane-anchored protein